MVYKNKMNKITQILTAILTINSIASLLWISKLQSNVNELIALNKKLNIKTKKSINNLNDKLTEKEDLLKDDIKDVKNSTSEKIENVKSITYEKIELLKENTNNKFANIYEQNSIIKENTIDKINLIKESNSQAIEALNNKTSNIIGNQNLYDYNVLKWIIILSFTAGCGYLIYTKAIYILSFPYASSVISHPIIKYITYPFYLVRSMFYGGSDNDGSNGGTTIPEYIHHTTTYNSTPQPTTDSPIVLTNPSDVISNISQQTTEIITNNPETLNAITEVFNRYS